jgi:hypothetical protein
MGRWGVGGGRGVVLLVALVLGRSCCESLGDGLCLALGSVAVTGADEVEGFGGASAPLGNPTASAQGVEPEALVVGDIARGGVGAFEFDCEATPTQALGVGEGVEDGDVGEAGAQAFALGVVALLGGALGFVGAVVGGKVEGGEVVEDGAEVGVFEWYTEGEACGIGEPEASHQGAIGGEDEAAHRGFALVGGGVRDKPLDLKPKHRVNIIYFIDAATPNVMFLLHPVTFGVGLKGWRWGVRGGRLPRLRRGVKVEGRLERRASPSSGRGASQADSFEASHLRCKPTVLPKHLRLASKKRICRTAAPQIRTMPRMSVRLVAWGRGLSRPLGEAVGR